MNRLSSILMLSIAAAFGAVIPAEAQTGAPARTPAQTQARPAAPAAAPASSVGGVTVQPQTQPQGRVVSSTDATSLTSPNYSADDAKPAPRALSLGGNAAAGVQPADNAPVAGLPASQSGGARHSDLGVTAVF